MAGFMDKIKKFVGNEDYDDEYDDLEEEVVEKEKPVVSESYVKSSTKNNTFEKNSNVVTMPNINRFLISVREPITFDDGTQVLDDVLKGKVVVLNLEMLEVDKKRQIFDFVSGGIYSLNGKIQKVTKDIFILAPKGIDIDGKVKDQIETTGFYQL
ncbi:MAG: cell division protein SepF [Peptoniphilaceae bacterium]|uniref:cell division protein SepF n=1 Tax=Parvimonas sp. TaxID=1944660 RepID=UPI0025EEC7BF|nr:cell division protein SepF [Parvimonas sp.]MCI5996708.1 cell division protein SepF [Parvimonas sp.]MDD7764309.1 cell division protein SepF [Peptoniphilaceae bacterium]MDY3050008.1 cell division protein SepF [Parvimonas sp.]